jgi:hypothetical protein
MCVLVCGVCLFMCTVRFSEAVVCKAGSSMDSRSVGGQGRAQRVLLCV